MPFRFCEANIDYLKCMLQTFIILAESSKLARFSYISGRYQFGEFLKSSITEMSNVSAIRRITFNPGFRSPRSIPPI